MLAVAGFLVVGLLGTVLIVWLGRHERAHPVEPYFDITESARRQGFVAGGLSGFAITSIVLLVALARDRSRVDTDFEAVVVAFIMGYISFVVVAFSFAFMPRAEGRTLLLARVHFVITDLTFYRAVYLAWFALVPLLQSYDLDLAAGTLLGAFVLVQTTGWALGSSVLRHTGLLRNIEALLVPVLAVSGAWAWTGLVALFAADLREGDALLPLAVVQIVLTATEFAVIQMLAYFWPELTSSARVRSRGDRVGRLLVLADAQLSLTLIAFMYIALFRLL